MRWILFLIGTVLWAQPTPSSTPPPSPAEVQRTALEKQRAAVALQRQVARKQAESVGAWIVDFRQPTGTGLANSSADGETVPEPCDPLPEESVSPLIEGAAKAQSLQFKLLHAVIDQESKFRPCAVSPKGAKGMMQLMPDTAQELGVTDPFDPKENIEAGARYLRQMLDKYKGDLPQALAAYNSGSSTVDQAGGIPNIKETKDYVNAILQKTGAIRTDLPNILMPKPIGN